MIAQKAGLFPCLFLDEFDKYNATAFQNDPIHALVDMICGGGGQVVCISNLDITAMNQKLGGAQYRDAIIRRLVDKTGGIYINFWTNKIYVNRVAHKIRITKEGPKLVPDVGDILEVANLPDGAVELYEQAPIDWSFLSHRKDRLTAAQGEGTSPSFSQEGRAMPRSAAHQLARRYRCKYPRRPSRRAPTHLE